VALSAPVELIRVQRHGNTAFRCAVADMQGWRTNHEDAHEMHLDGSLATCFVLDGHGGDQAAQIGAPQLVKELTAGKPSKLLPDEQIEKSFAAVDVHLRQHFEKHPDRDSGSTVIGTLCEKGADGCYAVKLLNAGDSRGVLVRSPKEEEASSGKLQMRRPSYLVDMGDHGIGNHTKGEPEEEPGVVQWPVIVETVDHKPDHPNEKARIHQAGGHVTEEEPPRLDGNLAVSRGIGDFEYKADSKREVAEQKVSCLPDIYEVSGLQPGTICILGCDGVWDVMTANFAASFVRDRLRNAPEADLGDIAAELISTSLKRNSRDNVTVMVIQFVDGSDWVNSPDEMKNYEKLSKLGELEDDVKNQYLSFLRSAKFPGEAIGCAVCHRWLSHMMQCPCKQIYYCGRQCQKKGWKAHKLVCPAVGASPHQA